MGTNLNTSMDIYDKKELAYLLDKIDGKDHFFNEVVEPDEAIPLYRRIVKEWAKRHIGETMTPKVGVGVFVFDLNFEKILLGKRKGSHGAGEYSLPGGHVDLGDTSENTAAKEVEEETGLKIEKIKQLGWADAFFPNEELVGKRQYVTLFYGSRIGYSQTPENREPNKCSGWGWYHLENLPEPLFGGIFKFLNDPSLHNNIMRYKNSNGDI